MSVAIIWFRQDLRCHDNPAFIAGCNNHPVVIPLYILDDQTLLGSAQKWWLHHSLLALEESLQKQGLPLLLRRGKAMDILSQLSQEFKVDTVYWNRCYEPSAIQRDSLIKKTLGGQGINVLSSNGSLLNEPWTIKNKSGGYFKVFTPFWRHCLTEMSIPEPMVKYGHPSAPPLYSEPLQDWNLLPEKPNWAAAFHTYWQPGENGAQKRLDRFINNALNGYHTSRDIPELDSTSRLSPHLHFGEISPWHLWRTLKQAQFAKDIDSASIERFLAELGWREFSYHLIYHFPELPHSNFKSEFNAFPWRIDDSGLRCWQQGMTGYPIIDAGMRELWQTGYMHNRVRMIVASFLTKDLMIDWQQGAAWFFDTLLDADLANNSASWQWVAGSGADAAPYFRIFNPILQSKKFDPHGNYIRQWVPELAKVPSEWIHQPWLAPQPVSGLIGKNYPKPIVDHDQAREQALSLYKMLPKKETQVGNGYK